MLLPQFRVPTVAIVGIGPTAIYTLRRLAIHPTPLTILLFEVGQKAGVGIPYDPERNTGELLANIASIELPPVCETLIDYLRRCGDDRLDEWGLRRDELDDRAFYPRVALGSYFAEQLTLLVVLARRNGHLVEIITQACVQDVIPLEGEIQLVVERNGRVLNRTCDKLVLATGHVDTPSIHDCLDSLHDDLKHIAIIGSSLSAIDLAIAIANKRGLFGEGTSATEATLPRITMMSRGGRLPEADFFCPLPATEAEGFRTADVLALVEITAEGRLLDAVFGLFATFVSASDPDYAERIGLSRLTADTFPEAYFAERDACDPFIWARRNLDEVRRNARAQRVIAWRYAILRCHEAFAACIPSLNADEMLRFAAGLKRVFVDNYAAVPPLSIERLLDLQAKGVLRLAKLEEDYRLDWHGISSGEVVSGATRIPFDWIFDARGQAIAADETFPFPTLRTLLLANHHFDDDQENRAVRVDDTFRLVSGVNRLQDIWCCSLPYLLDRRPFIQGLTSCAEIGTKAAEAILTDLGEQQTNKPVAMNDLISQMQTSHPILMTDGLVLVAPIDGRREPVPISPDRLSRPS